MALHMYTHTLFLEVSCYISLLNANATPDWKLVHLHELQPLLNVTETNILPWIMIPQQHSQLHVQTKKVFLFCGKNTFLTKLSSSRRLHSFSQQLCAQPFCNWVDTWEDVRELPAFQKLETSKYKMRLSRTLTHDAVQVMKSWAGAWRQEWSYWNMQ